MLFNWVSWWKFSLVRNEISVRVLNFVRKVVFRHNIFVNNESTLAAAVSCYDIEISQHPTRTWNSLKKVVTETNETKEAKNYENISVSWKWEFSCEKCLSSVAGKISFLIPSHSENCSSLLFMKSHHFKNERFENPKNYYCTFHVFI